MLPMSWKNLRRPWSIRLTTGKFGSNTVRIKAASNGPEACEISSVTASPPIPSALTISGELVTTPARSRYKKKTPTQYESNANQNLATVVDDRLVLGVLKRPTA